MIARGRSSRRRRFLRRESSCSRGLSGAAEDGPCFARRSQPAGKLTVADVLRRHVPAYLAKHGASVTAQQRRVLEKLMACRTEAMGGHGWQCLACDRVHYAYHSCKDRHCPTCGGTSRHVWLEKMLSWRLPTTYMHVVFTLPHELCGLIGLNPKALYPLFFEAASQTLLTLGKSILGLELGLMMMLHTWGQLAKHHVHLHTLATAGGLSLDGTRWIDASDTETFLSEAAMSEELRRRYLAGIERLYRQGKLVLPRSLAWIKSREDLHRWLAPLRAKAWHVNCQAPPEHCQGGGAAVLKYLARYISGVAIHDGRLISDDGKRVTFMAKDYRSKTRGPVTVSGEEFVRRFLLHILPARMRRIRYFGLLAPHQREEKLKLCRKLLPEVDEADDAESETSDPSREADAEWAGEEKEEQDEEKMRRCPRCGATELAWLGKFTASQIAAAKKRNLDQTGVPSAALPVPDS